MILSYPAIQQIWFLAVACLVVFVPGLVWVLWANSPKQDGVEKLADASAISLATIALFGMIFFFAGWKFSSLIIFLLLAAFGLALIASLLRRKIVFQKKRFFSVLGIVFFLGVAIIWRFYQARTLALPAWVDSVHHVLIVQKILDNHGLPATLAPELPVKLTYHYGFHIVTALWSAISHLDAVDSVLWFGQVLNALLALGVYRVAKVIWHKKRIAALAALLVTFSFQMPAYYLTWGRYTLITGLICLLPAMAASIEVVKRGASRESVLRLIFLTAGLALVHYMALLFLGLFVGCLLLERGLTWLVCRKRNINHVQVSGMWRLLGASLIGIVIALPWLLRMLHAQAVISVVQVNPPDWQDFKTTFQYIVYLLGPTQNYWMLGLAVPGLIIAWLQPRARIIALWSSLMVLLSIPWGLKLGPFRPDHMAIVLFLPAGWLLASGLVQIGGAASKKISRPFGNGMVVLIALALLGWGAWNTRSILNNVTILADSSDRQALDWINENTPQEARFFANTTIWQYRVFRGVDGGYWITPYTRRFSLAMPSLYSTGEGEQKENWSSWQTLASHVTTCDDQFWSLVREANLNYIYVSTGKGSLQPAGLENCATITRQYDNGEVSIYEIKAIP